MSFLRRGGRGLLVHQFTIVSYSQGGGFDPPTCSPDVTGFSVNYGIGSITSGSNFKGYTITEWMYEGLYTSDGGASCIPTGDTALYFAVSGYSGAQNALFRFIEMAGTRYFAGDASYSGTGSWSWLTPDSAPTSTTYKIFY